MPGINNFDVLKEMCSRGMDVRMSPCADNLVNVQQVRAGGHVTIGVDETTRSIMTEYALGSKRYNAVFLVFNVEQFDKVKKELASSNSPENPDNSPSKQ